MPSAAVLITFLEHYIAAYGLLIVFVSAFLENSIILGFIFPGVTAIFLAGFATRTTGGSLLPLVIVATLGSFLGDNFDYFVGKKMGTLLGAKPLFARPVAKVEPLIKKHGVWAIFAGRFSGWSRAWVALTCGIVKFPYLQFALVSFLSASIWTSAWIVGGYLLGGNKALIEQYLGRLSILSWVIFTVVLIYYFRTRIKLVIDLLIFSSKKYGRRVHGKIHGLRSARRQVEKDLVEEEELPL